ncbi:PAXNEB domain containing protein [Nitzschia inconspicua]|uniref:PAXNEB domain containing protein n=1 Tax=Nitzschia inconspicua TaxID=303405 RepID=A0A9K3KI86_9STRA|nr:PAXNEB domain containing protein [Nitzschia inconspicua]
MPSAFRRKTKIAEDTTITAVERSQDSTTTTSSTTNTQSSSSILSFSSFATLSGVKPWQGGLYLTSTGLQDWDVLLGGGQPLGTALLLQQDRFTTDLAESLLKYWCAEAISQNQRLVIVPIIVDSSSNGDDDDDDDDDDDFFVDGSQDRKHNETEQAVLSLLQTLPRNLHWDKWKMKHRQEQQKKNQQEQQQQSDSDNGITTMQDQQLSQPSMMMDIVEEENFEDEVEDEEYDDEFQPPQHVSDEGLQVAWQYKTSVQQQRLAIHTDNPSTSATRHHDVYCHSYDLSGRMIEQQWEDNNEKQEESKAYFLHPSTFIAATISINSSSNDNVYSDRNSRGMKLFQKLVQVVKDKINDDFDNGNNSTKAIRLVLYHPPMEELAVALPLFLAYTRKEGSWPIVVMIYGTKPTNELEAWMRLARNCDIVMSTEGFASRREYPPPSEFRHLQGILNITKTTKKLNQVTAWI